MKRKLPLAALATVALIAASVSAAPIPVDPVVLNDAQWASMVVDAPNAAFAGIIGGTDIAGDPGYQWDMTIVKVIEPYGLLNIASDTGTLGLAVTPGQGWDVEFNNPVTASIGVLLTAYVTGTELSGGGAYTGWVTQTGATTILPGTESVSWDLASGANEAQDDIVVISSVSKLGLTFIGDAGGPPGGGGSGEDLSLQVIPEPATIAMVGLFGGGLFAIRRIFSM